MAVKLYTPDDNVIVHQAKVDFRRRIVQRQVNLVQYDKSMPIIAVQLYSNGNEYVLPENASAYIRFGKRDHTYVYNECLGCDQTRTIVYFAITDQMTIFYGEHTPIVELRIGDTVAGSGSIPIWIDRNPIQNGDTESKSDLSVFEKAIEAAQKINVKLPTDVGKDANGFAVLRHDGAEIAGQRKTVKLADVRDNGAVIGRDQTTSAPQANEFITKAYADKSYGGLASSNTWTSDNHFDGLTTLDNVVVVGGIGSDGGGDFIALANDFSIQLGQAFKKVTGFVSPYQISGGVAYEALGFVNENALPDLSKASVLTYISLTGEPRWLDLSTNTMHSYQLPKKSGTIALTSDLSEAGTSVTIRRW